MWIVYNGNDNWSQGYSVSCESEAEQICKEDSEMKYIYVGLDTLTA